ncbi:50S ribosomal protein L9, apicoplast, putative [Plasmodium vinckei]|uniref:50S ribosomal protein L9, apicoplast, putative n=1 Tax=Plasmodium vinckei TaxID=5860 RepID=A0A6V7SGG8_PLAVN|nr:50S ribosomal protein L9, apicoplast, putative [Plasmodium vinckei]
MRCHFLLIPFLYILYLRELTDGYATYNIVKPNSTLYAVKKKKKKSSKYIDITVSSDNEIGTKGYRSTINELVDKEKNENTLRYIDEITKSFIWDYKKKLNDLIIPFEFRKNQNILITQDNLLDYLLRRGIIRENDDMYQKIKSKKIKFSDFGAYPIKYTFLDNISINITVQIIESK